jgi:hypothetical protein
MQFGLLILVVFLGFGVGLWLLSHIVEALRPLPQAPKTLRWAPEIPLHYVEVGGHRQTDERVSVSSRSSDR